MLQEFLMNANRNGVDKVFVYFKDENGEMQNICYQDNVFFRLDHNKRVRFLNPLRTMDTLAKIKNRELTFVGSGQYIQKIDFNKNHNRKGRKAWKLS